MTKRISFNWKIASKVKEKTGGLCFYCGCKFPVDSDFYDERGNVVVTKRNWHIDHMIPVCKNGSNNISNLIPSCSTCNIKKHTKSIEEFLYEIN